MVGQWWNGAAVFAGLRYALLRPSLLMPTFQSETLARVDWPKLKEVHGIEFVVFDKDNTLTAPYALELHPSVEDSVYLCQHVFYKSHIAILSNSAGTRDDAGHRWKTRIEREIGFQVITHQIKKPLGFHHVVQHFARNSGRKDIRASEILVVGDRLMTDVMLGTLHGAKTLHCTQTLELKGDNPAARAARTVESAVIMPLLRAAGVPPPEQIQIDV